jgi:hypothetical protein
MDGVLDNVLVDRECVKRACTRGGIRCTAVCIRKRE